MKSPAATGDTRAQDVIDELRRYVIGWLNYFGISHTYTVAGTGRMGPAKSAVVLLEAMEKQPRTRRRHLLALGIPREEVHMAAQPQRVLADECQQHLSNAP